MELTMNEKIRMEVIQCLMSTKISIREATRVLDLSKKQVYRILRSVSENGEQGVIHGNRFKICPFKTPENIKNQILDLVNGEYKDINDTHLCEILSREKRIKIGRETLRSILRNHGIQPKLARRHSKYRSRRERKEAFGVMLQIDGSDHDWLEGRGPRFTLLAARDDSTNFVWAKFELAETTWGYLELLKQIIQSKGIPLSLYSDRHTIFFSPSEPSILDQIQGKPPRTQFGRAMEELGITLIRAYSPQAKGRIERLFGILQDRLVVELRLTNANSLEKANVVLQKFLKGFNQKFCVPSRKLEPVFRKAPSSSILDRILCLKDVRTVQKDHTISFESLILQIPFSKKFHSLAGKKVDVLQLNSGGIEIVYKGQPVASFNPNAVTRLVKNSNGARTNLKFAA